MLCSSFLLAICFTHGSVYTQRCSLFVQDYLYKDDPTANPLRRKSSPFGTKGRFAYRLRGYRVECLSLQPRASLPTAFIVNDLGSLTLGSLSCDGGHSMLQVSLESLSSCGDLDTENRDKEMLIPCLLCCSLQSNLLSWLRKYDVFSPASIMNCPQANHTISYIHCFGHMHGHVDKGTPFWKIKKWKPSWAVCNRAGTYKSFLEQTPTHDLCLPFVCKKF